MPKANKKELIKLLERGILLALENKEPYFVQVTRTGVSVDIIHRNSFSPRNITLRMKDTLTFFLNIPDGVSFANQPATKWDQRIEIGIVEVKTLINTDVSYIAEQIEKVIFNGGHFTLVSEATKEKIKNELNRKRAKARAGFFK